MQHTQAQDLIRSLFSHANTQRAEISLRFFKTGKGQYGEGDLFWGIPVPITRRICRDFVHLSLSEIQILLTHAIHEVRLAGVILLARRFQKSKTPKERTEIRCIYLAHVGINNWDLVDVSAPDILGKSFLLGEVDADFFYTLARHENLWKRRMAIVAHLWVVKQGKFDVFYHVLRMLLADGHDLIHKACGWILRESIKHGGKSRAQKFFVDFCGQIPPTMLRYAIEHFSAPERQNILASARLVRQKQGKRKRV